MSQPKGLNIKGTVLEKKQLENYLAKLASDHILQNGSNKKTYPIPRLLANFATITKVYYLLNEHLKMGINIHPAGEWLLDNYYIIEETVKMIQRDLSLSKYTSFLGISNGVYKGYARIYVLASEMVAYTENRIDQENLMDMLMAYQSKKTLSMEEIWNIGVFIHLALIENMAEVCEKIYSSQMQKYRVENILERYLEEDFSRQNFPLKGYQSQKFGFGEMKYPFIEYMSYRLKKLGRKAHRYLDILEEQVEKMGSNISEVIKKEHFDIAFRKVLIGNSILSMKRLQRINFLKIFEKINGVEEILNEDPAGIYEKMDHSTKEYYRNIIKKLSQKTKISEMYIAKKLVEMAKKNQCLVSEGQKQRTETEKEESKTIKKKTHIGYYLMTEGKGDLMIALGIKEQMYKVKKQTKVKIYLSCLVGVSLLLSLGLAFLLRHKVSYFVLIGVALLSFLPWMEITTKWIQAILNKVVKPRKIPKLDFAKEIPEDSATFVIIPTIIKSEDKVRELFSKLEVYHLANPTPNLYFALLGDCSNSKNQIELEDQMIQEIGQKEAERLNQKYPDFVFPKFHFFYRKRVWSEGENSYLGWERKRGLISQFNRYLLWGEKSDFIANTVEQRKEKAKLPPISYVITLDADTDLILGSAGEMVGAMAHLLNQPVLNQTKNLVVEGHALLQPKIGIDIIASRKSLFTKIYAGAGGTDSYTNAISDTYQDNFGEGIFTGKGIYDLAVFTQIMEQEIPEKTVLSHDLLEGNYLRCGLASDILVMDGYPFKYNAFMNRLHRWIRGDWQIRRWIGKTITNAKGEKAKNPLNLLSRYKIFDNLRRSVTEIAVILLWVFALFIFPHHLGTAVALFLIGLLAIWSPMLLEIGERIVGKKEAEEQQKNFIPTIHGIKGSLLRGVLDFGFLPNKAYQSGNAIVKTIYRTKVSKKHLLEWTTAEEAEKTAKTDLLSYYRYMSANIALGLLVLLVGVFTSHWVMRAVFEIVGLFWMIMPYLAFYMSKEELPVPTIQKVSAEDQAYLLEIGKNTWQFFKDTLNEKNHFLPPDNYQEERKEVWVERTSSTNIGLALLAVISSYDLGYEPLENTVELLEKMLGTIEKLSKWNGHLYNWYQIKTLQPLPPRYVSTVDSGNFVGYLYVVKQFLTSILEKKSHLIEKKEQLESMIGLVDKWICDTDFRPLYDEKVRLFSIGFHVEENKLTDSYYDLLASEARQASLVAIAKRDIPAKHWSNLSRTLTTLYQHKGLISWSGTAFEYLMPNINIRKYDGSLLDESCRFMVYSQKEYSKRLGIPWGMSEAAFNVKDLHSNYQYKAFGIPWLGLKRGLADEAVISGYGSMLWLPENPNLVISNIQQLEKEGILGKYGVYEAIDYTTNRLKFGEKSAVVKTFMAHHQGLILLSINNLFQNNILQVRFHDNPEIKAVDILLQEQMPENVIITKEKKEKPEKITYKDYENYSEKIYSDQESALVKVNAISNGEYTIVTNQKGESFSKYQDRHIYRFRETADQSQGILFFLKDIKTKRIWSSNQVPYLAKPDKYTIHYLPDHVKIDRMDGNMETISKTGIVPDQPIEIRQLEVTNHGTEEETIEITSFLEPILSTKGQDTSHMAFNNLFLKYEYEEETGSLVIRRKNRENQEEDFYLGVNLYTEKETIGELEYEIDKEKFCGRENFGLPDRIKESKPLSKQVGLVTQPIVALKRTIRIQPKETVYLYLLLSVGEQKESMLENLKSYLNKGKITRVFELSKARAAEESRYLGIKGSEMETYQEMLGLLVFQNVAKKWYLPQMPKRTYAQEELWKFGLSGELPILLVKIQDVNDHYVVEDALKAYEFYRLKNILIELVILNEEKYRYDQYVNSAIEEAISNRHLEYRKNQYGGIFVIHANDLGKDDLDLLRYRANLVLESHLGTIQSQIEGLEEDYLRLIRHKGEYENKEILLPQETIRSNGLEKKGDANSLKYYNEYGAFSKAGNEYWIKTNKEHRLPTTWSHILCNENFGTVVTDGMGGYTWNKNSRLNRISSWNNDPCLDIPSEVIYLKDLKTQKEWSLGERPLPDDNDYYITYGFGYAKYEHTSSGIIQEAEVFVPKQDAVKVTVLSLNNTNPEKKKLKLLYYIKPVLGEDELKANGNIFVTKDTNLIYAQNLVNQDFKEQKVYVSCSEDILSYTGSKDTFMGQGNVHRPDALSKVELDCSGGLGENSCLAIEIEVEIEAYEKKEIVFTLGAEASVLDIKNRAYQYTNLSNARQKLYEVVEYWRELTGRVQIKTPIESMNILLNGWIVYQTIASRLWGKTGYYQSGGAFGFRDQLQDTLGLKYFDPNFLKQQVLLHAKHQFLQGDVEHWWHEDTQRGIRTKFSDDLLWLVYVTCEYIQTTGDVSVLEEEIPYLQADELEEGVMEKYNYYPESGQTGTLYEHCIKAIERSLSFGENGLPKIGSGDWNDGFSNVGSKGKGESIWLGFFLYNVLTRFIPLINDKKDFALSERYEQVKENLKRALNTKGWDGRWYKRAFMDSGDVLGSIENEECRIDNIAQSWSVISGAGDNDKKYISMEAMENHLIDRENSIIKLLDPPFEKGKLQPGYIKSYLPGVRENGGQYTHGAVWAIIAETMLGFGDKAGEMFRMINPIEHARTKEAARKYKVEPYVVAADVYGAGNLAGRGGWTWYTGSSSWLYKAGIEYILGLKIEAGILTVDPCIPKEWKNYTIHYRYHSSNYYITVKNPKERNAQVESFIVNGEEIPDKQIRLIDDGKTYEIEVTL